MTKVCIEFTTLYILASIDLSNGDELNDGMDDLAAEESGMDLSESVMPFHQIPAD